MDWVNVYVTEGAKVSQVEIRYQKLPTNPPHITFSFYNKIHILLLLYPSNCIFRICVRSVCLYS